jgi:hypothetical protein
MINDNITVWILTKTRKNIKVVSIMCRNRLKRNCSSKIHLKILATAVIIITVKFKKLKNRLYYLYFIIEII